MLQSLTISVPQPCHEDWAAMTPASQGRHCAACAKTVVDFTRMSDAELVTYFAGHDGPVCGRLYAGQLSRSFLLAPEKPPKRRPWWLAAAFALMGLRNLVPTVAWAKQQPVFMQPVDAAVPAQRIPEQPRLTIKGQVVDTTGAPVPFVAVGFKHLRVNVLSDEHGVFTITLSAAQLLGHTTDTLLVAVLGYKEYRLPIDLTIAPSLLTPTLMMHVNHTITTGMVVRDKTPIKPPKHPR